MTKNTKVFYRIFFDESCHLKNDLSSVMTVGYIKVPDLEYSYLFNRLKKIKEQNQYFYELKWNKVIKSQMSFYKELIDFFFETNLTFRCTKVLHKQRLTNDFYYYAIYYALNPMNEKDTEYGVFLDIKDSRSGEKLKKIAEIFNNKNKGNSPFRFFKHIHSEDNLFIELADFFIGAVNYKTRLRYKDKELKAPSPVKLEIIEYLERKSGYLLDSKTPIITKEKKFNLFEFSPTKNYHK
ncbi:DUF3800 domain-containing protein [Putridiphycobacter roseus]|uniref:DUF3800 domain-containing protein n=1 Tax=Putridiphycobacter roseus TaxID=2219161 RepID=A0A2W1NGU7_9FLAO|nr:DUF3800 domain-containing protein [Putridiphycobacter roseus]PZE18725.1 DUF3800 domain-containing protein [Putridiphycobacter roseus]